MKCRICASNNFFIWTRIQYCSPVYLDQVALPQGRAPLSGPSPTPGPRRFKLNFQSQANLITSHISRIPAPRKANCCNTCTWMDRRAKWLTVSSCIALLITGYPDTIHNHRQQTPVNAISSFFHFVAVLAKIYQHIPTPSCVALRIRRGSQRYSHILIHFFTLFVAELRLALPLLWLPLQASQPVAGFVTKGTAKRVAKKNLTFHLDDSPFLLHQLVHSCFPGRPKEMQECLYSFA